MVAKRSIQVGRSSQKSAPDCGLDGRDRAKGFAARRSGGDAPKSCQKFEGCVARPWSAKNVTVSAVGCVLHTSCGRDGASAHTSDIGHIHVKAVHAGTIDGTRCEEFTAADLFELLEHRRASPQVRAACALRSALAAVLADQVRHGSWPGASLQLLEGCVHSEAHVYTCSMLCGTVCNCEGLRPTQQLVMAAP